MNQSPLPIKSKIVAWTMIIIGAICSISLVLFLMVSILIQITHSYTLYEAPTFAGFLMILLVPTIYLISPALLGTAEAGIFLSSYKYAPILPYLFIPTLFVLFGFSLLKRKRWAWWGALSFLIINIWFVTYQLILAYPGENVFIYRNPSFYISGVLLILLLLDKNNYWKVSP